MKLIYCPICGDTRGLGLEQRKCACGKSGGKYVDDLNAEYWGWAIPLGFANSSLDQAIKDQPTKAGSGTDFTAFVIPERCDSFKQVEDDGT